MGKKRARWARPEISRLVADLGVADEEVRGDVVRSLCPFQAVAVAEAWAAFSISLIA